MTNKLPQGWVDCKMKDVLEFSQGIQVDVNLQQDSKISDEYIRFLRIVDFTQKTEPPRYVLNPPTHVIVTDDDISMVRYGAAGFVCTGLNGAIANNLFRIIPKENIFNNRFLYYFLIGDSFQNYIKHKQTGTTMQAISFKIMNEADIVVPPLNEQKRIVEKIEEEFGKIDEGVEKLKSAQEQIKQYRQSVLNQQFKIKHAETLTLNDVTTKINDGTHKTPIYVNVGIPFISVKDIKNKQIYFDNCKFITKEEHEVLYKRCNPEKGDVLITKSGTIGRTAVVDTDIIFDLFVSVALLKPQREKITSEFLMYTLDNYISHIDVKQDVKGGLIKNLHIEDIKKIKINLPTLDEQKQIVKEIEKRFEVADEVEKIITENLEKAEQLKQSILKKAFEGRLVPQDPTDEPASELLAKIQTERKK